MGLFDKLGNVLSSKKRDFNLLVVGLDNSGKSTLINCLKASDNKSAVINPTVGFSAEKFAFKSLNFTCFDMSGQSRYRNLWEHYYRECDAILFVVDSADKMRFVVAQEELQDMLSHPELKNKGAPVLVFANKCDLKGGLNPSELRKELELDAIIRGKPWRVFASSATQADGVAEGLDWLIQQIAPN
jgi:ADP-ribosylation factor-like protein 6